jgi:hypothetical protein
MYLRFVNCKIEESVLKGAFVAKKIVQNVKVLDLENNCPHHVGYESRQELRISLCGDAIQLAK